MMTTPTISIYVRHSAGCKHANNELYKRCDCRKWLRWTQDGTRVRRKADTRSWAEAEQVRHDLELTLTGRGAEPDKVTRTIRAAAEVFLADKKIENVAPIILTRYKLWLERLALYCDRCRVYTVDAVTREITTGFCGDWGQLYPSPLTRNKLRERYIAFFSFCVAAKWIEQAPTWPKMPPGQQSPTMPLNAEEYAALLASVETVIRKRRYLDDVKGQDYWIARVRGLFTLMRWSGLAIMDALSLPRTSLARGADGMYRVVTQRTKTGTDVSVVLPPAIAEEILRVPNDNTTYLFWSGVGQKRSMVTNWGTQFIVPCFAAAGIADTGWMKAHRLRDTFAVELLTQGVSIEDVSKLLGHRSIAVTEKHYAAWVPGRQTRLDQIVQATFSKA